MKSVEKAEFVKENTTVALAVPEPAAGLDRAGRINYYHHISAEAGRISIVAALAAGLELQRAKEECEHGMFLAWVKKNCAFTDRTARKYLALADGLLGGEAAPALLEMPAPARREALAEVAGELDARSLTELYTDLGIVKPSVNRMGGARPGAGRPPKEPDANAALNEALILANKLVGDLSTWVLGDDGFGNLPDDVLQQCVTMLSDITKRGRDILSGRKLAAKAPGKARSADK